MSSSTETNITHNKPPLAYRLETPKIVSCPTSPLTSPSQLLVSPTSLRPSTPDFKPLRFAGRRSPSSVRRSPITRRDSPVVFEDPYQKGFEEGYKKAMEDVAYKEKREVKVTLRTDSPQLLQMLSTTQLQSLMEIKETLKQLAMDKNNDEILEK